MSNQLQIKAPSEAFRFRAGNGSVKELETGTFSLEPYALGQAVDHWYWGRFVFEASSMKMYKEEIPALVDHDTMKGCGRIKSMKKDGKVSMSGEFIDNEHAKYVKSMKGLMECSLRFNESQTDIEEIKEGNEIEVDGFKHQGPLFVFRNAPIMEVSFTLFGAVPNTSTSFSKRETVMADAPITKSADVSAVIEKMSGMCSDAQFVLQCFKKGMGIEEFSANLLGKQNLEIEQFKKEIEAKDAEILSLKEKLAKPNAGSNPVVFNAPSDKSDSAPKTYLEAIEKFKAEGKDQKSAMSLACKNFPELYKVFVGRK
jgi:hypothetical protein